MKNKTDDAIELVKRTAIAQLELPEAETILRALTLLKNYEGIDWEGMKKPVNSEYDISIMWNAALDELKSKMEE